MVLGLGLSTLRRSLTNIRPGAAGYHHPPPTTQHPTTQHPTSRFYGPAMTRLPDTFGHYIGVYKDARASAANFDFEDTGGGYLFEGRDGRPFSVSSWTTVVKDTWKRHCGLSPPPKLLRAIFICWLRDQAHTNKATPEVLKARIYHPPILPPPTALTFLHILFYMNTPYSVTYVPHARSRVPL